jgi:hypothetical protein
MKLPAFGLMTGGVPPRSVISALLVAYTNRKSRPVFVELIGVTSSATSQPEFLVPPMLVNWLPGKPRDGLIGTDRMASFTFLS